MSDLDRILNDPNLKADILANLDSQELSSQLGYKPELIKGFLENFTPGLEAQGGEAPEGLEAIVKLVGRPVLLIQNGTYQLPTSDLWKQRLSTNRPKIESAIVSVGRVEVRNHPRLDWVGTAWVVKDNIAVTNRHVASEFSRRSGSEFTFKHTFMNDVMKARVDLREEFHRPEEVEFRVTKVLHIADENDADVAFLEVRSNSDDNDPLPPPIKLATSDPALGTKVAVIGYPAKDSRNDSTAMEKIFGSIFNVKRLAPGEITSKQGEILEHDCSTLGGNSGSVVLDIETGEAVGLHFAGKFRVGNSAVSATKVAQMLSSL